MVFVDTLHRQGIGVPSTALLALPADLHALSADGRPVQHDDPGSASIRWNDLIFNYGR
jgi:hypothetical protein